MAETETLHVHVDATVAVLALALAAGLVALSRLLDRTHLDTRARKKSAQDRLQLLRGRLAGTSMVDQFVQYARVEREISSLDADMKREGDATASHPVFALARPTVAQAALGVVLALVFPATPVASFPTALLGPFDRVLALPFCSKGDVSAPVFALVVYNVLNALW